jgi:3-hydroxyisobutyrate dehydrogenase-like beta-hydroxyacid dehydrogenase
MAKDLRYAHAAADHQGVALTTAEPAEKLFREAQQQGHAEQDMSAAVETVRAK